jgi:hypothetical protein
MYFIPLIHIYRKIFDIQDVPHLKEDLLVSLSLWRNQLPHLEPLPDREVLFVDVGASWASYLLCVYHYVHLVLLTPDFLKCIEENRLSDPHLLAGVESMREITKLTRGYLLHNPVFHLMPVFLAHCIFYCGVMHCVYSLRDQQYRASIADHIRALDIMAGTIMPRVRIECDLLSDYLLYPDRAVPYLHDKCKYFGLFF